MNISIMILPKVILVSLLLFFVMETQSKFSDEWDLINYLACARNDSALLDEQLLSWKDNGYDSYTELITKHINLGGRSEIFDLDSLLAEDDKKRIEQILNSSNSLKLDSDYLKCSDKLNKIKGFLPKKTIYAYSYPIVLKGIDQELYGIIMEQKIFEINNELKLKVFLKRSDCWELVYESLIAFS